MATKGCELLAKVCIFDILNNREKLWLNKLDVVNCSQKFVSLIFWTTNQPIRLICLVLWIARKSLYLWYSEQPHDKHEQQRPCCELLAKVCIFDILNNYRTLLVAISTVVNCSQKFVSLIFWTTCYWLYIFSHLLWIARKSLYLWYSEQPLVAVLFILRSCELLAKVCIFDILNNIKKNVFTLLELWIARKSLYLWYSEQQAEAVQFWYGRCELLAKVCIFDILNNNWKRTMLTRMVVNCSQKFVSLIFWTTNANV